MSLLIDGAAAGQDLGVGVDAGDWVVVEHADAEIVVSQIAGLRPSDLRVVLDGEDLSRLAAFDRHRARLCVAGCRLDQLPALRVADVVGLGLRAPQPALWRSLVGTAGTRAQSADDEAQVRALCGRVGLAEWTDRTAVNLPLRVEALVDLARALAGGPKALVWRRPEWLDPASLQEITDAVVTEQQLAGFAVVEFVRSRPGSLPQQ